MVKNLNFLMMQIYGIYMIDFHCKEAFIWNNTLGVHGFP